MEILNLTLANWRNFASRKIIFDPKLTVIIGPNGAGKSNILESIFYISGIRPNKVETDLDLVKFNSSDAKIEAAVRSSEENHKLIINLQVVDERNIKKSYFVDEFRKRLLDFVDIFAVVVFAPADLDLVSGSPSARRHYLDRLLSSGDRDYWRNISAYNKVVVRRNRILQRIQEGKSRPIELNFWDLRLLEHAKFISKKRADFFEFLNFVEGANIIQGSVGEGALALGHSLSRGQRSEVNLHEVGASQNPEPTPSRATSPRSKKISADATRKNLTGFSWALKQSLLSEEKLAKNRDRDIAAGVTLSGPHRDDFRFIFRGRDLEFFGSRGEQRMAVLALKLAELEYYKLNHGIRPILALDDIFSELDWEHRETVLSVIGSQQTIITAAEAESVPKVIFKKAKIVEL